jgi:hypothetical protein
MEPLPLGDSTASQTMTYSRRLLVWLSATIAALIHPSAWKGNSAKFTLMELGIFARVPPEYPVRGFTEGERKPRAVPSLYRALALLCRLWANFALTEF